MLLIIGTKNKAKIGQVRSALRTLNLDLQGLPNLNFPDIKEDGATALENARLKAIFYAKTIGSPVLSTDNALFFDGFTSDHQPGVNVRRISGQENRASDYEVLAYYSKLVRELGGKINGFFEYAFCLAFPDGRTKEIVIKSPRIFISEPSSVIVEGYPLLSIQINSETNQYLSEMTVKEQDDFWQKTIGRDLCNFIKDNLIL